VGQAQYELRLAIPLGMTVWRGTTSESRQLLPLKLEEARTLAFCRSFLFQIPPPQKIRMEGSGQRRGMRARGTPRGAGFWVLAWYRRVRCGIGSPRKRGGQL